VRREWLWIGVRSIYLHFLNWTGLLNSPFIITFRLTGDDQVSAGADWLDPQVSSDLTLVLAVVGQRRVGDSQVEDTGVLIADQFQPGMAHDFAVCNISSGLCVELHHCAFVGIDRSMEISRLTLFASWLRSGVIHERIRG